MNKCQCCGGTAKLVTVSAKCSDRCYTRTAKGVEAVGYVPEWLGGPESYGDYINIIICRHCGHVHGDWSYYDKQINKFKHGKVS